MSRASEGPFGRHCFVKVFVDECVDWRLSRDIVGHEVKTARQIVLRARTNRLVDLQALVPELLASIPTAKPGAVTYVGA